MKKNNIILTKLNKNKNSFIHLIKTNTHFFFKYIKKSTTFLSLLFNQCNDICLYNIIVVSYTFK